MQTIEDSRAHKLISIIATHIFVLLLIEIYLIYKYINVYKQKTYLQILQVLTSKLVSSSIKKSLLESKVEVSIFNLYFVTPETDI